MSNGPIGKILFFWIFVLGGMFFARIMGFPKDDKSTIILCIALALVYIVWNVARYLGKRNRTQKEAVKTAENRTPVHKGQSHKKKKKR